MKGEVALSVAGGEDRDPTELSQEKGSFYAASPWRRICIAAFGPLFNLAFALAIFTIIWWAGFSIYSADNRIVLATDYALDTFASPPPATAAGLRTGDRVVAIDGAPVEKFQDIIETVSVSPGRRFTFTVRRQEAGAERTLSVPVTPELDRSSGAGRIGVYSWVDPVVDTVTPASAAFIAGLAKGDRILSIGDRAIRSSIDLSAALAAKPQKVSVRFDRGGVVENATIVLMYDEKGVPNLGVGFAARIYRSTPVGLPGAIVKSLGETYTTAALTVKGIGLLFRGIKLRNAVAGPLRITWYIGSAATSGFQLGFSVGVVSFFRFLSFLSVVLFLMNLLPFPALDGGQIILYLIELGRGRPVRPRIAWRVQLFGFSLLIVVSLFITFSDILFFLGR
jgi:regulator of sigma E protease